MNISNNSISRKKQEYLTFGHESFNSDFIIPDYYSDISKILKCSVVPNVEAITTSSDKVSVSGEASVNLIYLSEDNRIICYDNCIKYTKVFQIADIEENDCVFATQEVISNNVRALGPKRINVNGTIEIKIKVEGMESKEFIESVNENLIQTKSSELSLFNTTFVSQKTITLNKSVKTETSEKIVGILRKECTLNVNELRVINGKTYISGIYSVKLICIDDECKVNIVTFDVPFSEVTETQNSKENDECFISNIDNYLNVLVKTDNEQNCSFDITIRSTFMLTCGAYAEYNMIEDVYAMDRELTTQMQIDPVASKIIKHNQVLTISYDMNCSDEITDIADTYVSDVNITFEKNNNKTLLVLDCKCGIMTKNADGSFRFVEDKYTSEYSSLSDNLDSEYVIVNVKVLSCSALQSVDGKVKLTCDICVDYVETIVCKVNLFTQIAANAKTDNDNKCGIVLYFAQKNEDIWNIAKENRTTVKHIMDINNLSEEKLDNDHLLIFPKF